MKSRILFSIFSCFDVHDHSMAANANAQMIVLFTSVWFGCAKVKISVKNDYDSQQIIEEPDRHCLPVPQQLY
jgi:hypothetical protein